MAAAALTVLLACGGAGVWYASEQREQERWGTGARAGGETADGRHGDLQGTGETEGRGGPLDGAGAELDDGEGPAGRSDATAVAADEVHAGLVGLDGAEGGRRSEARRGTWAMPLARKRDAGQAVVLRRGPYLQQVGRTSAIVVWETDQPTVASLRYGPVGGRRRTWSIPEAKRRHVARLRGLQPGTRYEYAVELEGEEGPDREFQTEGQAWEPFRVAVFGDTRTGHRDHRATVEALVRERPAIALHTGDLVGLGTSTRHWDSFFHIEQPLLSRVQLYPCLGNHEEDGELYLEAFELPDDSPHPERYYTFTYGSAWFAILDLYGAGFDEGGAQLRWLESELQLAMASQDLRHRIVMLHHGPFDSGHHGPNMVVRERLVPLFERYGVDVVFSGHDHHYERGTVAGIKYVVTGGSGAPLRDVHGGFWTQRKASVLHYVVLDIEGPWLSYVAKKLDGSILDRFELGTDVFECESVEDCEGSAEAACEGETTGRWVCVRGGCVPDCDDVAGWDGVRD